MASTTSNEAPPAHVVNFGCGHPDASLLPNQLVADATTKALTSDGQEWLQYARENGNLHARQALATFLTRLYYSHGKQVVDPETFCITSGVSHGIQLTCRALARLHSSLSERRPLCLMEDPTYFLVPAIFRQSGYELQAVTTCAERGLHVQHLEKVLMEVREKDPQRLVLLYIIPTHHNPLGVSLPEDDRQFCVQLCEKYDVYMIADEVYQGLGFPPENSNTLAPMALRSSKIISVSAFTKILCPGIRCGWIQTLDTGLLRSIGQDGVLDSGGCSSQLSSGIVTSMMDPVASDVVSPLEAYMCCLQIEYAKRCRCVCQLLQASNDGSSRFGFEFEVPHGGYFLWVRITGVDFLVDEAFRLFCKTRFDVDFKTGISCSAAAWKESDGEMTNDSQHPLGQCMRLCFAYYDEATLTLGVERLCRAIHAYSELPQRTLVSEGERTNVHNVAL